MSTLDTYFKPQANCTCEGSLFRRTVQLPNETIEQYITRLRQRAETCEFGDRNAIDERIRDQVVDKCLNHSPRQKPLEKGRTLNLTVLRETAKAFEDSARQAKAIDNRMQAVKSDVNRVHFVKKKSPGAISSHSAKSASICYSCGFEGHLRTDPKCPARENVPKLVILRYNARQKIVIKILNECRERCNKCRNNRQMCPVMMNMLSV